MITVPRRTKTSRSAWQMPALAYRQGFWGGINRLLNTPLLFNGLPAASKKQFLGASCGADVWNSFDSLVNLPVVAGAAPTMGISSPYRGNYDVGAKGNGGGHYQSASASDCDITTEDIWFEAVHTHELGTEAFASKFYAATLTGWEMLTVQSGDSSAVYFRLGQSSSYVDLVAPCGGPGLYYTCGGINRDEASAYGAQIMANCSSNAVGVDMSSMSGSVTSPANVALLARPGGSIPYNGVLYYFGLFLRPDWFRSGVDGYNDFLAMGRSRTNAFQGLDPTVNYSPTVMLAGGGPSVGPYHVGSLTHGSQARRTYGGTRRWFMMGSDLGRFSTDVDRDGAEFVGVVVEGDFTNEALQSNSLDNAAWTKISSTISANEQNGGDGRATLDGIIGDAETAVHGISQAITCTAETWCFSAETLYRGNAWCKLECSTIDGAYAYFNRSTGLWGTIGSAVLGHWVVTEYGGSLYRIGISFLATAASHTFRIIEASADGVDERAGDGLTVLGNWGHVMVEASDYPHNPLDAVAAASEHSHDYCSFLLPNLIPGQQEGSVKFRFFAPEFAPLVRRYLISIDDTGNNNAIQVYIDAGSTSITLRSASGGVANTVVGPNACDNKIHECMVTWKKGTCSLWIDSTKISVSPTNPPISMAEVRIGYGPALTQYAWPVRINDLQVFPDFQSNP